MKDERRPAKNAAADSLVTSESSSENGRSASALSWAHVDATLEVRERLVAMVDALEAADVHTARVNATWLLEDLDGIA